jgi:hypothetical protein
VSRSARAWTFLIAGAATALVLSSPASPAFSNIHDRHHDHDGDLRKVTDRLDGPRGVAALGAGRTLVTESDGTFSLVIERRHHRARTVKLGKIATRFAPAVDVGPGGRVYLLTTGSDVGGAKNAARLFQWRPGWRSPREVADIAAYQKRDKDPYDLERKPRESNPYGVEALDDGTVLVADAAGNDLLQVDHHGDIDTVARFKPRKVKVPSGLGTRDAEGSRLPAAGTWVKSESVPTSVTEGDDGYWYVGELRGWPATPGTSQIWRIRPGSEDEVCDPRDPRDRDCKRYADGLTSIVDLAADEDDDTIYALPSACRRSPGCAWRWAREEPRSADCSPSSETTGTGHGTTTDADVTGTGRAGSTTTGPAAGTTGGGTTVATTTGATGATAMTAGS